MVQHNAMQQSEYSTRPLKVEHPQLYGKLLEVDAALKDAGGMLVIVYLLLLIVTYCGLWFEWYKRIPQLAGVDLGSVWVYALVFVVIGGVWIAHFQVVQRLCYEQYRHELMQFATNAKLTKYQLMAEIEQDAAVRDVAEALKRDRWEQLF